MPDCSAEQQALNDAIAVLGAAGYALGEAQGNFDAAFANAAAAQAAYDACVGTTPPRAVKAKKNNGKRVKR